MKIELLNQVLETEKAVKREGKGIYTVGDDVELTVLLEMGQEVMSVGRVRKLTSQAELLILETHKGERYYIGPDTGVRGLKFAEQENNKLRGAGFTSRPS
jgi:hypothetical protein